MRSIGSMLQDARCDGLRVGDGFFQSLNRCGGHIGLTKEPPPFVAAAGDEFFLQQSVQYVVVCKTIVVFGETVIRGKRRQADCRTKFFELGVRSNRHQE
mgnify:CR=1 FL=1